MKDRAFAAVYFLVTWGLWTALYLLVVWGMR